MSAFTESVVEEAEDVPGTSRRTGGFETRPYHNAPHIPDAVARWVAANGQVPQRNHAPRCPMWRGRNGDFYKVGSCTGGFQTRPYHNPARLKSCFEGHTIWLTQRRFAELFEASVPDIGICLKAVREEGELDAGATIKPHLQVRAEATRSMWPVLNGKKP